MLKDFHGNDRPDPFHKLQNSKRGDRIAGIFNPPQRGYNVLDVGGFQEFQAAVFYKRDISLSQFDFQLRAVVRRPEKHRLVPQVDARLPVLKDFIRDIFRLTRLVFRQRKPGLFVGKSFRKTGFW